MVQPADTKAPLSPNDTNYGTPLETRGGNINNEQYARSTSQDKSGASQPLLSQDEDAELGPAPPYYPRDEEDSNIVKVDAPRQKNCKRTARRAIVWASIGAITTLLLIAAFAPRRPFFGRHRPHNVSGNHGDKLSSTEGDANVRNLACASFDKNGWTEFDYNVPRAPGRIPDHEGILYSQNVSFLVPTNSVGDVFTHLVGEYGIGQIFVETYQASDKTFEHDKKDAILPKDGVDLSNGEYVRAVIEPIILVTPDEELEDSWGLQILQAADVCLMERYDSKSCGFSGRKGFSHMRRNGEKDGERTGLGAGVYTTKVEDVPQNNRPRLQFRIYLRVPVADTSSLSATHAASFADGLLDVLALKKIKTNPKNTPKGYLRDFNIRSGVGSTYLHDLTGAAIGSIGLDTGVGEIHIENLRAEDVSARTTGHIKAAIAVENELIVDTPVGEANLDLTVATPPDFALPGKDFNVCDLPPVHVFAHTSSGSLNIKYVGWEDTCRTLAGEATSSVGSVDIHSHPAFQGDISLGSAIGSIKVDVEDEVEDPSGAGRVRKVKLEKHSRLGSSSYTGSVKWQEQNSKRSKHGKHGEQKGKKLVPGLQARTSVGSIRLTL